MSRRNPRWRRPPSSTCASTTSRCVGVQCSPTRATPSFRILTCFLASCQARNATEINRHCRMSWNGEKRLDQGEKLFRRIGMDPVIGFGEADDRGVAKPRGDRRLVLRRRRARFAAGDEQRRADRQRSPPAARESRQASATKASIAWRLIRQWRRPVAQHEVLQQKRAFGRVAEWRRWPGFCVRRRRRRVIVPRSSACSGLHTRRRHRASSGR